MARNPPQRLRRTRGFTLIELFTVIAIFSVLAALAVGSLGNLTWNQRLNEIALEYYAAINKGRSEGMRVSRGTIVQLLLDDDVGTDDDIQIVAFFDEDGDYIFTEGADTVIHRHFINRNWLSGLTGAPAVTYGEQLNFDDGGTFVTSKWDGTAIPRSILFNSQGFSYQWGASATERILHSVDVQISDPVNIASTLIKRLEVTVAGATRLRTCTSATVCD